MNRLSLLDMFSAVLAHVHVLRGMERVVGRPAKSAKLQVFTNFVRLLVRVSLAQLILRVISDNEGV